MKKLCKFLSLAMVAILLAASLASCIVIVNPNADTTAPTTGTNAPSTDEGTPEDKYPTITVAEALKLCTDTAGYITSERYYIRATVISVKNAAYGNMIIGDETGEIEVYGTYSADGSVGYAAMEEKPYKGDEVLLHCILQNYNGKKEVQNARLIEFQRAESTFNEADYTDMTVAEARETAVGTKIKVDGVVARITYANGKIPSGVYLMDETQTIYIYDGDLAQRVTIGNKITVCASKTYWILADEQNNAAKFGYQGCCQLESATLISNDGKTDNPLPTEKLPASTVKALMETPVTENITTATYKVTAQVVKKPGNGFVNYYFYDLDGKTGSYAYTQCNGSDFAWLDAFDGKICTVYLSAINAKSTSTDCFFRFLPVAVVDEGFRFDLAETPKHVVEYYGVGQFLASYSGNPELELITSVSSELLGFANATLSYASDNESVVYFTTANGKTVMNCKDNGTATVTVTGAYDGKTYNATVKITVSKGGEIVTTTVADAISKTVGETVTVKGIVGPSLVNKTGFYLFDETGMISVIINADLFQGLQIGHEIILEGKRDCFKDADKTHAGQIALTDCKILANNYGNHPYPTDKFITDKTLADIGKLNVNEDHTTEVYVVKATVNFVETAYYSTISLEHGGAKLSLYCSGANQYSFLKPYAGQEVTLEIAPCNWNNKTAYVGCVLAVRTADGTVVNSLNFPK